MTERDKDEEPLLSEPQPKNDKKPSIKKTIKGKKNHQINLHKLLNLYNPRMARTLETPTIKDFSNKNVNKKADKLFTSENLAGFNIENLEGNLSHPINYGQCFDKIIMSSFSKPIEEKSKTKYLVGSGAKGVKTKKKESRLLDQVQEGKLNPLLNFSLQPTPANYGQNIILVLGEEEEESELEEEDLACSSTNEKRETGALSYGKKKSFYSIIKNEIQAESEIIKKFNEMKKEMKKNRLKESFKKQSTVNVHKHSGLENVNLNNLHISKTLGSETDRENEVIEDLEKKLASRLSQGSSGKRVSFKDNIPKEKLEEVLFVKSIKEFNAENTFIPTGKKNLTDEDDNDNKSEHEGTKCKCGCILF